MGFELKSYIKWKPFFNSIAKFIKIDSKTIYIFIVVGTIFISLLLCIFLCVFYKILKSLTCVKYILCCYWCLDPYERYKKLDDDEDDQNWVMVEKPRVELK